MAGFATVSATIDAASAPSVVVTICMSARSAFRDDLDGGGGRMARDEQAALDRRGDRCRPPAPACRTPRGSRQSGLPTLHPQYHGRMVRGSARYTGSRIEAAARGPLRETPVVRAIVSIEESAREAPPGSRS